MSGVADPGTRRVERPAGTSITERGSDYARLSRLIRSRGLLDRRPGYYAMKIVFTAALFGGGWAAFAVVGDSWWQLPVAGYQSTSVSTKHAKLKPSIIR